MNPPGGGVATADGHACPQGAAFCHDPERHGVERSVCQSFAYTRRAQVLRMGRQVADLEVCDVDSISAAPLAGAHDPVSASRIYEPPRRYSRRR